jgi:hypothetical protein
MARHVARPLLRLIHVERVVEHGRGVREPTGEILALARRLSDSSPVLYDTFYVYKSE